MIKERSVDWKKDGELIRTLFGTTWKGHPITSTDYFNWQFLEKPRSEGIGYCAISSENPNFCAGFYAVIPSTILMGDCRVAFSTSLYTITHPDYYKRGIFETLARKAFEECGKAGIYGTIGVPNNKSLYGFIKGLGFKSIGQFQVLARIANMPVKSKTSIKIRTVYNEKDLSQCLFELDLLKAKSGVILSERSLDFISWRFLRCPGVKYNVVVALDNSEIVRGMMVLRSARRMGIPIMVVLDFLVDETFSMAGDVANALLRAADRFAWRYLSPLIVTLVNPNCYEAKLFFRKGFKSLPSIMLPHSSNFIIKLHSNISDDMPGKLFRFENWYFSFADYDIF